MPPARYLYLVDIETEQPLAIFPVDHLSREGEVITYEAQLRAQHNVDDPESGLVLKDSLFDPLPESVLHKFAQGFSRAYARFQQKTGRH